MPWENRKLTLDYATSSLVFFDYCRLRMATIKVLPDQSQGGTPEEVRNRVIEAAEFIPISSLGNNGRLRLLALCRRYVYLARRCLRQGEEPGRGDSDGREGSWNLGSQKNEAMGSHRGYQDARPDFQRGSFYESA